MGFDGYGLAKGNPANLVILDAKDLRTAFTYHTEPLYVIRNGRVSCETRVKRTHHPAK
jgi:cytosine deaminase